MTTAMDDDDDDGDGDDDVDNDVNYPYAQKGTLGVAGGW